VISPVALVRAANRAFRYGEPKQEIIPESARALLIFLRFNSPPGALTSIVTNDGRASTLTAIYPDHKGETIRAAVEVAEEFIAKNPMGAISIRLDSNRGAPDAAWWNPERVKDFIYYMIGPLLPARAHTLHVLRKESGEYVPFEVKTVARDGLPPWLEDFRKASLEKYKKEASSRRPGRVFSWPSELQDWQASDVDQWFENEELRIRAVAINTKDLLVEDQKALGSAPIYQPTQSWTRGVQFVMAGGSMGILAAINDEVERSHVANITLILFVIFVLHSVTYQSAASGGIILLQITTATTLSLAYMALMNIGLNINTLPVQSVGVGIGVDYAIYIVDRIRQECADTADIDEAVRRAVRTTGMAVSFTATTIVGGIVLWSFSNLRFQAEMAQLLSILMVINMLGAITVVPAFYSILRPKVATALLTDEQREAIRIQKEREVKLGLRDEQELT
jgi:hypothetical protein